MARILVTGATGNIGSRVAKALFDKGIESRLFVRNVGKARTLFKNDSELAEGDLDDRQSLEGAMQGVDKVLLISTGNHIPKHDALVASVAKEAKIKHIVKLSSLGGRTALGAATIGNLHLQGEESIRQSGVPFTFVQSVAFMSNAIGWKKSIREKGMVQTSTGAGRVAMIHPDDVADVLVKILMADAYKGQSIQVTGPELLSYSDMVSSLSRAIGQDIEFQSVTDDEAYADLVAAGMEAHFAAALVGVWCSIREGRTEVLSADLEAICQRKGRTFGEFAIENAHEFR